MVQNFLLALNLPYYCEMVKLHYNALTVFEKEPFVKRRCQACFTGMCFSTKIISDETPRILDLVEWNLENGFIEIATIAKASMGSSIILDSIS